MPDEGSDDSRRRELNAILNRAVELEPSERSRFLDAACPEDPRLRAELERILALDSEADRFFAEPLADLRIFDREPLSSAVLETAIQLPGPLPNQPPRSLEATRPFNGERPASGPWEDADPWIGRQVGPYRIEDVLGSGGMGVVYRAVRASDFEQQVALKLLRRDVDSKEILERFYAERQILAQLEHPGIARLLDGGTTGDGSPYFAMELVEGQPIDRYCDRRRLDLRERLDLFRQVCAAVHFAHQNLIVHRDLKPSNILVTADGSPRLLDFGIAKILQPELSPYAATTQAGRSPMTPSYASPEQIRRQPITTISDVYALGVLLYRLLTGRHPYRLAGQGYQKIVELICSTEPIRPSLAVRRTGSTAGGLGPPRRLGQRLAGDLDAIVLKAMRKEPGHRYGSAAELAEDLRRHRDGLPVLARQGTWLYYTGKFLRRNKWALIAVLLIVGFAVTATVLWRQAVRERTVAVAARAQAEREQVRAQREQLRAVRVTQFLEGLFRSARPDETRGEDLTVLEVLERGRQRLADELVDQPETRAELLGILGTVYRDLGLYGETAELMGQALELRRRSDPADRPQLAIDISNFASSLYAVGRYEEAGEYFRQALDMRRRLGQGDIEVHVTLHNLAATLGHLGRDQEAERLHRENLEIRLRVYGPGSPQEATTVYSLGSLYARRLDFAAAEPLLRRALEIRFQAFGAGHTKVAEVLTSLGKTLHASGRHDEARQLLEQALEIRLQRLGGDHSSVAATRRNLAAVLLEQGHLEAAGDLLRQALATLSQTQSEGSFAIAETRRLLGTYLVARQRFGEAEIELLASYRVLRQVRGEHAPATRDALRQMIALYEAWGRPSAAEGYRAALISRPRPGTPGSS